MLGDEYIKATGVILSRKMIRDNALWVHLFLKEYGIMTVTSPYGRDGFYGDTEPFVWGIFGLQHRAKGNGYHIYDIDAKDVMYHIRRGRDPIVTALSWTRKLIEYMIFGHPDNELLTHLYWCMKLLCSPRIPVDAADWRFMWLWLRTWGLAPDVISFYSANNFSDDEITLLALISQTDYNGMYKLFSAPLGLRIRENALKIASRLAMNFLLEK